MNRPCQHAKCMYPECMVVFECPTHSCREGEQVEVARAAMTTQRTPWDGEQQQIVETVSKRGSRGPDGSVIEHVTQRYPGPDGRTQHVGSHRRDRLDKEV